MTRLEQLRIDRGLSARALAAEVGVSTQTIVNIEGGKPALASTLKKLGDYFKVPASSLSRPAEFNSPTTGEAA